MENSQVARGGARNGALLICPNQGMLDELAPLLSHHLPGLPVVSVKEYPDREGLAKLVDDGAPQLCFLDMVSDVGRAQEVVADLLAIAPGAQIVVLLADNAPDLILQCLRRGASEFLIHPFSSEDLNPVLQRLSQLNSAVSYRKGARVYCVAPTKGACGASTIASNLAYQRKRLGFGKVLLADMDPMTGTISFLLNLKSSYSFLDALSRSSQLDEDLWRGIINPCDGVDVLLSPDNPMDGIHELSDPTPVLEYARQLYDAVIVDCAGVYGDWGLALATTCDEFLLVTTNELPALRATQKVLAYLDRNRVERSKIRLLVNRYSREVGLSKEAIATALHTEVFHVVPSDYESVQKALMEGRPIPSNSAFGKSLIALADRLVGRQTESAPNGKRSSWGGIFTSIFSKGTT